MSVGGRAGTGVAAMEGGVLVPAHIFSETKMSDVQFCAELKSTLTHFSISFPFLMRDSFGLL